MNASSSKKMNMVCDHNIFFPVYFLHVNYCENINCCFDIDQLLTVNLLFILNFFLFRKPHIFLIPVIPENEKRHIDPILVFLKHGVLDRPKIVLYGKKFVGRGSAFCH